MVRYRIYHYYGLVLRPRPTRVRNQDFAFLLLLREFFGAGGGSGGGAGATISGVSSSSNTNFFTTMCSLTSPPTGSSALSTLPSVSRRRAYVGEGKRQVYQPQRL